MKVHIAIVTGFLLFHFVTSSDVMYACQYPGCTCEELSVASQNFSLTCFVGPKPAVILPHRNFSINIVSVTLLCDKDQGDASVLLDSVHYDLQHVQILILRNCVTSLASVFNSSRFSKLTTLSLDKATLSDQDVIDVISQRPLLTALEVTQSYGVRLQTICSLTKLFHLTLTGNQITNLNDPTCNTKPTLSNLITLDVSHNDISNFPRVAVNAPFLSELYLQFNKLSNIPADVFQSTTHLTILDLSHNDLTSLPTSLLSQQVALSYLNLSCNQLTGIPESLLANTENLSRLDLSFNKIRYLQAGVFENLHNLEILNLSSNSMSYLLRSHLTNLKALQYLDLGTNRLRNIPDVTSCQNLVVLDFRQNVIRQILGSSLRGLSKLQGIGFRNNRLTHLRLEDIAVSRNLSVLDVSHNNISYIDYRSSINVSVDLTVTDSLSVLSGVRILLLNNNQLKDIYRLERVFTGLETLMLDHNQISSLSSLDYPLSLKRLSLSYNHISFIEPFMFKRFPHLEAVSLQANYPYLTSLPVNRVIIDKQADPKPQMYLTGNLFTCDCQMTYLKMYLEGDEHESFRHFSTNLPEFIDVSIILCITERDATIRKLADVAEEEFICVNDGKLCEFLCQCCGLDHIDKPCPCLHNCPSTCTCTQAGSPFGVYDYKTYCDNSSVNSVPQVIPPPTTYLYLDHTNITELRRDEFVNLTNLKQLFLNQSQISTLHPGCFNGLGEVTHLYLSDNNLKTLSAAVWTGLSHVTHLCLQNNQIHNLEPGTFVNLTQLQYLDLSHNLLTRISTAYFPHLPPSTNIVITHNPLSCCCSDMRQSVPFLASYGPNVAMLDSLRCIASSNQTKRNATSPSIGSLFKGQGEENFTSSETETVLIKAFDIDECNKNVTILNETRYEKQTFIEDSRYAVTLSVLCVLFAIVITLAVVSYWKRREVQAWLFVKFGVRVRPQNASLDETGRTYDAFVSYSSHDEHLVVHELAPRLEEGLGERRRKRHYQLCLHYRDFPVGDCIADTIIESIEASKRTIMLLSDNFLSSEWCRYEFQTAHHHVLKERSHRLIIVLLHDIDDRKLDPDLRVHLKTGNFLRYSDPWFWEKLYFALPDVPVDRRGGNQDHVNNEQRQTSANNDWVNVALENDKLEINLDNIQHTDQIS